MNQNKKAFYFLSFLMGLLSCITQAKTLEVAGAKFSEISLNVGAGQSSISTCDFNSDGNQDVIIASYLDNNIMAFRGDGKGGLIAVGHYSVGERPTGMDVSDINNDGNVDIAIANHETSYVTLLYGDGKGGFKKVPQSPLNIEIKPHPHDVRLNDLDGDNRVDLIVDSRTDEGLLVLKGLADGGFKMPGKIVKLAYKLDRHLLERFGSERMR